MKKDSLAQTQTHHGYNPGRLLDLVLKTLQLRDDSALSRKLKVATTVIKNIRHGKMPVAASMLIWMHEATGISIEQLRHWMGDRRASFRPAYVVAH
jgi:antitoxin HigA-1